MALHHLRPSAGPRACDARPLLARPLAPLPLKARRAPLVVVAANQNQAAGDGPVGTLTKGDIAKEEARKQCRTVFSFDSWEVHRCSGRYFRHLAGAFGSKILQGLVQPLAYVIGISTAVAALEALRQQAGNALAALIPCLHLQFRELFGFTSFALSLLLVFRTNASYERWDGARKTWGLVLNRSRDLVRLGLAHFRAERAEARAMLCRWVPAFSRALMCHLRKGEDLEGHLKGVLLPHEIPQVMAAQHRPNFVLQVITEIIKAGSPRAVAALRMEDNLTAFEDCLGGCERVLRTPIPLSYTRHTSRFLMIWLTLLPFALVGACGWATVPLCATIAFLLLGVEEIGVSIEEPFSILPLEAICTTALLNVQELQARHGGAGDSSAAAPPGQLSAAQLVLQGTGGAPAARAPSANGNGVHANGNGVYANGNGNGAHANGNRSRSGGGDGVGAPRRVARVAGARREAPGGAGCQRALSGPLGGPLVRP